MSVLRRDLVMRSTSGRITRVPFWVYVLVALVAGPVVSLLAYAKGSGDWAADLIGVPIGLLLVGCVLLAGFSEDSPE